MHTFIAQLLQGSRLAALEVSVTFVHSSYIVLRTLLTASANVDLSGFPKDTIGVWDLLTIGFALFNPTFLERLQD
jgi:hypothetical protein